MNARRFSSRRRSRGFGMAYVLTVLALLSVAAMAMARFGSQGADGKRMADMRDELVSQASLIRSKLIACMLAYPGGDPATHAVLPLTTNSGTDVGALTCPGDPNTDQSLWKPADGVYAPRQLNGLTTWTFVHTTSTANTSTISITKTGGGNPVAAALNNAALRFGQQATINGPTLTVSIAN